MLEHELVEGLVVEFADEFLGARFVEGARFFHKAEEGAATAALTRGMNPI